MPKRLIVAGALSILLRIVSNAISRQLTDEFKASTPWIAKQFIRIAARISPKTERERVMEEWSCNNAEIAGELLRILDALGCVIAAAKIQYESRDWRAMASETWMRAKTWIAVYLFLAGLYLRLWTRRGLVLTGLVREQPTTNEANQTMLAILLIVIVYLYTRALETASKPTPVEAA
jgi:hypothetical protein